jgi:7,8-dihydroneopterin aldolase/epimerase/oxygenase
MDTIYISGLKIDTVIGVLPWERHIRQKVIIDIEIAWDMAKSASRDNLADTLNYSTIVEKVTSFVESSSCLLIETLAHESVVFLLKEFPITWCRLRLAKPGAIPTAREVGVVIERTVVS